MRQRRFCNEEVAGLASEFRCFDAYSVFATSDFGITVHKISLVVRWN